MLEVLGQRRHRGLLPRRRRDELIHHLIEEQLHDPHRRLRTEDHQTEPAAARRREAGEQAALAGTVMDQSLEPRDEPISRASSSVDAPIPAPRAAAVITSSERLNPCCATTCPDEVMSSVSRADDSSRKVWSGTSTQGSSERIRPPGSRRRASPGGRDRRWHRGRRPDEHEVVRTGRGEDGAALRAELHEGGSPRPAAAAVRTRRPTRLPASAAAARPSTPSISCSATTRPSPAEASRAPRTPGTRVTRSSRS